MSTPRTMSINNRDREVRLPRDGMESGRLRAMLERRFVRT